MADIIQANYAEMQAISNRVSKLSEDYTKEVNAVYTKIDNLSNEWQGTDNLSFVNQAKSYEKDLLALGDVISDYSKFLRGSADIISETQNDIASAAGKM